MAALTAVAGNPAIPLRREREIARFEASARQAIADLQAHFDADAHLTPEQMADYRRARAAYSGSGTAPFTDGPSAA